MVYVPTYTCGDKQIQQGSVAGYKMVVVNAYSKNAGWAALLGEWLTNEENQAIRFQTREIGPSNTAVAASEDVAANIAIAAPVDSGKILNVLLFFCFLFIIINPCYIKFLDL